MNRISRSRPCFDLAESVHHRYFSGLENIMFCALPCTKTTAEVNNRSLNSEIPHLLIVSVVFEEIEVEILNQEGLSPQLV